MQIRKVTLALTFGNCYNGSLSFLLLFYVYLSRRQKLETNVNNNDPKSITSNVLKASDSGNEKRPHRFVPNMQYNIQRWSNMTRNEFTEVYHVNMLKIKF